MLRIAATRARVRPLTVSRILPLNQRAISTAPAIDKPVATWLLGCAGMVATMVGVGGLTRLTKSGLSMTDWKPLGGLPPISNEEWEEEFARYKTFPEWQQRKSMTLEEFKFIFWWEYGHRQLGRGVGVVFTLPMLYFLSRGRLSAIKPKVAALFGLGAAQGAVGWWMVKSGLALDPKQKKEIRVSPYRLTTHLGMAFTTYSLLLWTALDVLNPPAIAKKAVADMPAALQRSAAQLRGHSLLTAGLVFTTAMSGAFVAGNDAGHAFNTFPKMNDEWVPSEVLDMSPWWKNPFENTATVQFDHRVMALMSTLSVIGTYAISRGKVRPALPPTTTTAVTGMLGMLGVQVSLGISTLLYYVPIDLAVSHQLGSLGLLSFALWSAHSLRFIPFAAGPVLLSGAAAVSAPAAAIFIATNMPQLQQQEIEK